MLSLSANAAAKEWWKSNVLTTTLINIWKMLLVNVQGEHFVTLLCGLAMSSI